MTIPRNSIFYFCLLILHFLIFHIPCDTCLLMLIHPLLPGVTGFSVCSSAPHFPAGQFRLSHTTYCPIWWATVPPESYRVRQDLHTHAPAPGFMGTIGSFLDQMSLSWEGPVSTLNVGSTLTPPITCRCGYAHLSSQRGACAPPLLHRFPSNVHVKVGSRGPSPTQESPTQ